MRISSLQRRQLMLGAVALACSVPNLALAQAKLKVAAIYTVPFEQQWVSRLHKALKAAEARGEIEYKASENVSNADYERVMREYATGGNTLIVGEAFAVEALVVEPELVGLEAQLRDRADPVRVRPIRKKSLDAHAKFSHGQAFPGSRRTEATLRMPSAICSQSFSESCGGMSR